MTEPQPAFGFTRHGRLAVHARVYDHLANGTAISRFNARLAVQITKIIGSMWCAYAFSLLALLSLPAILVLAFHVTWFPGWLVSAGLIALVAWIAQTFLQLVLLSIILVGQDVQAQASDARAIKTFEDGEHVIDLLRLDTDGGLKELYDKLSAEIKARKL